MTRRITISIPDDVAEQLDAIPRRQVSAYVTEALRRRQASDHMRAVLKAAGHREYPYDPDAANAHLSQHRISPEVHEAALTRIAELTGLTIESVRAHVVRKSER